MMFSKQFTDKEDGGKQIADFANKPGVKVKHIVNNYSYWIVFYEKVK